MKIDPLRLLALVLLAAAPAAALTNPVFLVADPADPQFGWETRGAVSVSAGAAVIQEDDRVLSRLAQTFVVPQGAQTLRFTLVAENLADRDPLQPPDAFEVALIDVATSAPLAGTAAGLSDTDALLNLQPSGEVFFSSKVNVPGAGASGQVAALRFPVIIEVDLRGVAEGTQATLSFDLLGFSPTGSSIAIDDVFVMREGAAAPVVTAGGPYSGLINEPISFDAGGTVDADGPIVLYEWDFESDGVIDFSSAAPTATHTYTAAGSYTVTLRVTDDTGLTVRDTASVSVLGVQPRNRPPVCSAAKSSPDRIWPPNHKYVTVKVLGATDPDNDSVKIVIDRIRQDEPVNGMGDGDKSPDGEGVGTATAKVRAERAGSGDGRVYHIFFSATDGKGGACTGEVRVGVPHDQGQGSVPVDGGSLFDSTTR